MADKIDQLTIPNSSGTEVNYDIDLPPDATPSIASLTTSGDVTVGGTLKFSTLNIPTSSGGTTYGAGSSGQVLKSNGTTVYWASDSNSNYYHTPLFSSGLKIGTGTGVNDLYVPYAATTSPGTVIVGNGLSISSGGTVSVSYGSSGSSTSVSRSDHAHGNINNGGTITSTAVTTASGVVVVDSNNNIQKVTSMSDFRTIIGAGTSSFSGSYNDLTNKPTIPTSFTITVTDDILDGTGGANSVKYAPYSSKGAGHFYTGTTNPSSTNRLNYDGNFYATALYKGGTEVKPITITTTSGSQSVSDGTNTLSFGANAFNSTTIPTTYLSSASVSGNTLTLTPSSGTAVTFTPSAMTVVDLGNDATSGTIALSNWDALISDSCVVKLGGHSLYKDIYTTGQLAILSYQYFNGSSLTTISFTKGSSNISWTKIIVSVMARQYQHNIRVYRSTYINARFSLLTTSDTALTYSSGSLSKALNAAGHTSSTTALPASGMMYYTASGYVYTVVVTGVYATNQTTNLTFVGVVMVETTTSNTTATIKNQPGTDVTYSHTLSSSYTINDSVRTL